MYIVAASLLGNFALNVYVYLWGPEPPFSRYNFAREALVVEEVRPTSAADQAGIQVGDRVLAIDGRRVRGLGQWDLIRINFEIGKPYRLQVERDGRAFERVMTPQRQSWSQQTQYQRIRFGRLFSRLYATLRLGSPDWVVVHRAARRIPLYLWCVHHCPALANRRGCARLVAASGLFHISHIVLRFLLKFPAQILPFSLDLAGERASSFFLAAHRWLHLLHICESFGRVRRFGLASTYRWQSPFCIHGRRVGCADSELPQVG